MYPTLENGKGVKQSSVQRRQPYERFVITMVQISSLDLQLEPEVLGSRAVLPHVTRAAHPP